MVNRGRARATILGLLLATGYPATGWSAAAVERYEGHAYGREDGRLRYRETHWHDPDGRRIVVYRCPGGEPFARKVVQPSGAAAAPDFEFLDARDGYREGVRSRQGAREVFLQERTGSSLKSRPLTMRAGGVIDAGFDALVRQQWDRLGAADGVVVPFLLPSRFAFYPIRIAPVSREQPPDHERRFRMTLDHWLGFALKPIELRYSLRDRRLLEFRGVATIRDAKGRHQDVRLVYPVAERVQGLSRGEFAKALALPLVSGCRG